MQIGVNMHRKSKATTSNHRNLIGEKLMIPSKLLGIISFFLKFVKILSYYEKDTLTISGRSRMLRLRAGGCKGAGARARS